MKRIVFLMVISLFSYTAMAQVTDGSTLEQPEKVPTEFPWTQEDVGDFSDPVPYVPQKQADVMYSITVWRTIDLREKMNHPLYFPVEPRGTWRSLAKVIFDAIDFNNIDNTEALPLYRSDFCTEEVPRSSIRDAIYNVTTTPDIDPETQEIIGYKDISEDFTPSQVLEYRIKEVWFFDKHRSLQDVRIMTIAPIIEYVRASSSEGLAYQEEDDEAVVATTQKKWLGYIKYDELRPYLAKQEVYNVRNNSQRLSLDDLLTWKRQFSSYIYAEGNQYGDRWIVDYIANARDQRIESENISNKIRVWEHDLWEF